MLEFRSGTSDSIREYVLLQDKVFEYVNGAIVNIKNETLLRV